jgi:hypothetical protein
VYGGTGGVTTSLGRTVGCFTSSHYLVEHLLVALALCDDFREKSDVVE